MSAEHQLVLGRRLTIHLGAADRCVEAGHQRHTPLGTELLLRAHRAHLHGATVLRGIEGFGHSTHIHRAGVWTMVDRTPLVIVVIDTADRVDAFVRANGDLLSQCLTTVSEVRIVGRPVGTAP